MASPNLMGLLMFAIAALFFVNTYASSNQGSDHHQAIQFSYAGGTGPGRWGSLNSNYTMCLKGKHQSPINIQKNKALVNQNLKPLIRSYKRTNVTLVNHGFNIGLHFPENSGGMIVDGIMYDLVQMHWHIPSEHRINGKRYAAELHLVHITEGWKNVTVLATLYKYGKPDPLITKIQNQLNKVAYNAKFLDNAPVEFGPFNPKQLQKRSRKYYRYSGSFTTPPCTEHVIWNVLGKVRSISEEQIEALEAPLDFRCKKNARPCQPINGRHVEVYEAHSNN